MWYAVILDGQVVRRYNLDDEGAAALREVVVAGTEVVAQPDFVQMPADEIEKLVFDLRDKLASQGLDSVLFADNGNNGEHVCAIDAGGYKLLALHSVIREHLTKITQELTLGDLLRKFAPGIAN